ncbi:MAG: BlaI/MecI/CopY family transcriptional regulator [Armatimonadota bacterium]|nr:BlaI/MecI/CopY family transcriptional regulator [Armatimonadota bacterium]
MSSNEGARDYVGIRRSLGGGSLGELEAQIMDIVWNLEPPVTSSQVFKIMYPRRELSYSTIMLTMAKLSRKGILTQTRTGTKKTDPFVYSPNISREEMGVKLMDEVARKVLGKPLNEALQSLCGGAVSSERLAKLIENAESKISKITKG